MRKSIVAGESNSGIFPTQQQDDAVGALYLLDNNLSLLAKTSVVVMQARRAARAKSPIRPRLSVLWWRVRHRCVSSAAGELPWGKLEGQGRKFSLLLTTRFGNAVAVNT
ncbi:hypothetical protein OHS81_32970 [Streptomyces sp. NBC_00400]|uniref:hypothetical protein n=1 Tax=Streptomyces sp. NBC_00400 TaxID=2975737 RepID=UPI002E1AD7D3